MLLLVFALLAMFPKIALAYQASATRELPSTTLANSTFNVTIELDINESDSPSGVILKDWVPLGFNVTLSDPLGYFYPSTGLIKWVLFGSGVRDRSIVYTVDVNASDYGEYAFSGEVVTLDQTIAIGGDQVLSLSLVSGVSNSTITNDSVLITWKTDANSSSMVELGTSSCNYTQNISVDEMVTDHTIYLTDLSPGTVYFYVVSGADSNGKTFKGAEYKFVTKSPGDLDFDGTLEDTELLEYIEQWKIGLVSDDYLIAAVNSWIETCI